MRVVLTFILKNHVHDLDNQMRKQTKVGLIGLELTADLARSRRCGGIRRYAEDVATRPQEMSIIQKMNKRYVDDINMATQAAPDGLRYRNVQIFKDEGAVEEDKESVRMKGQ